MQTPGSTSSLFVLLLCVRLTVPHTEKVVKADVRSPLIVVSFDGFRPEYFQRNLTPNFDAVRERSSRVPYMRNVFPTKTFPNHFSIATGLYAGAHGVTGNTVFDLSLNRTLGYGYELFHQRNDIVPIWTLNEMLGGRSGCMMWPGSDFTYGPGNNVSCTYSTAYNHSLMWRQKVDTVLEWLTSKEMPANLVMLYFDEPDFDGHVYSPDSDRVNQMINRTDQIVLYLQSQLIERDLIHTTNVIYLSDHGMNSIRSPNFINLTDLMTADTFDVYGNTPVMQIVPRAGHADQVLAEISAAARRDGHFKVYTAETLPERWNVVNAGRTGPLTVVADIHYAFQDMWRQIEYYRVKFNVTLSPDHEYGMHGYDNAEESMHAIFVATGPAFLSNYTMDPFDSVELYRLFGVLIGVAIDEMPANNGTCIHGLHILRGNTWNPGMYYYDRLILYMNIYLLVILIILMMIIGVALCYMTVMAKPQRRTRRRAGAATARKRAPGWVGPADERQLL